MNSFVIIIKFYITSQVFLESLEREKGSNPIGLRQPFSGKKFSGRKQMLLVSLFLSPVRIVALNQNQVVETCVCTHTSRKRCNSKQRKKKNRTLIYQKLIKVGHNKQVLTKMKKTLY